VRIELNEEAVAAILFIVVAACIIVALFLNK